MTDGLPVSRRGTVVATLTGSVAVTLIAAVQALVMAPFFLREIGVALYGAWLASGDLLVWLQSFDLGLPNLIIQRIGAAHARGDRRAVGRYLGAAVVVLGGLAAMLAATAWLVAGQLPGWFGITGDDRSVLAGSFAVAGVSAATVVLTNAAVGLGRGVQSTGFLSGLATVAVAAGFAVALSALLSGAGLWAAAWGAATRAAITVVGSAAFVTWHRRRQTFEGLTPSREALAELVAISPMTAAGGLAYSAMSQSETALIAAMAGPERAAAYALTRRALDLGRAVVDMIGSATYGSFSHLVASSARARAFDVLRQIATVRATLATLVIGVYLAVNRDVVALWVGPEQYGGALLSLGFAAQMLVAGHAYLLNYLYRGTGAVAQGSMALLVEGLVRVPLMVVLLWAIGTLAVPWAAVATALVAAGWTVRRTAQALGTGTPPPRARVTPWMVRALSVGLAVAAVQWMPENARSWVGLAPDVMVAGAVAAAVLWMLDPEMRHIVRGVWRRGGG